MNRPDTLSIGHSNAAKLRPSSQQQQQDKEVRKTSFAQLQRQKSSDNVISARDSDQQQNLPLSLKEQYDRNKTGGGGTQKNAPSGGKKTTTFAALPNQTTWSEFALKNSTGSSKSSTGSPATDTTGSEPAEGDAQTPQAEMLNIRMMLGESRRKIEGEKRKTEVQLSKQRQRVGKQAFMQVPASSNSTVLRVSIYSEGVRF